MPDDKLPIPQFAAKIKAKYPEYKDVNDTLLTQKILEKYPEYKDMVDMNAPVEKKNSVGSVNGTLNGSGRQSEDEQIRQLMLGVKGSKRTQQDVDIEQRWNKVNNPENTFKFDEEDPVGSVHNIVLSKIPEVKRYDTKPAVSSTAVSKQTLSPDLSRKEISEPTKQGEMTFSEARKTVDEVRNYFSRNTNAAIAHLMKVTGETNQQVLYSDEYDETLRSKLRSGNETDRASYERIVEARDANYAIQNSRNLVEAAITNAARKDPQIARQVQLAQQSIQPNNIGNILSGETKTAMGRPEDMFDESTLGRLMFDFMNNSANIQEIFRNPQMAKEYKEMLPDLINRYPDFGKTYLGNIISQKMEDMGMNNGVLNVVTKDEADKVVAALEKDGVFGANEKRFYEKEIRDNLGLKNLGRKIIGKQTIDTPGVLENVLSSGVKGATDIPKGVYELSGLRKLLVNEKDIVATDLGKADSQVGVKPKGLIHEITQTGGNFMGQSLSIGGGGGLLNTLKIAKDMRTAVGLAGGLQAYANYIPQARQMFPGDELKQRGYASILSYIELATENIFNDRKIIDAILGKVKPGVVETIKDFTAKKISAEAAGKSIQTLLREAGGFYAKGVGENTFEEVAAELGSQITEGVFKGRPVGEIIDGEDLWNVGRQSFLGSAFIAGLSARADMQRSRGVTAKTIYEMAQNPEAWKQEMTEAAKLDEDLEKELPDKIQNLEYAAAILKDIEGSSMTEKQKVKYLITELDNKVKADQSAAKTSPILKKQDEEVIKENQKVQEDLLSGKDDGSIEGDISDELPPPSSISETPEQPSEPVPESQTPTQETTPSTGLSRGDVEQEIADLNYMAQKEPHEFATIYFDEKDFGRWQENEGTLKADAMIEARRQIEEDKLLQQDPSLSSNTPSKEQAANEKEVTEVPFQTEAEKSSEAIINKESQSAAEGSIPPTEPPKEPVVEEGESDIGGITQAANAVRRTDRGLPEYQREPQSFEQWNNEAERLLKNGYDVEKLMNKIEFGNHIPNEVENAIRKIYYATIDAEVAKNPTDELLAKQKRIAQVGDVANTRLGRGLVSLKGEGSPLSSISDFYVSAMEAKNTDKLTDTEKAEVKKDYEEVKAARDKADKIAQDATAKFEEMKAENELLKQQLAAKNKTKSDKVYTPDGKRDFKAEIKNYKDELIKAKEEHEKWMKDNGIHTQGGGIILTGKMAKIILKIAATHVEQVGVKIAEVAQRTWDDVKDIFDGITEKDIRDVFAGVYNEKKPTRPEIIAQMRELKSESILLNEYENLLKRGEPKEEVRKQKRNQRLTDIRKQIDALNKERGIGKYSDEAIAKRAIEANKRKRAEFEEKLRKGDFEKEPKPTSIYDSPDFKKKNPKLYNELLDTQNQAHDAQLKFEKKLVEEEMKKWGLGEKLRNIAKKTSGTIKTLFASFDASAIAIQNLPFIYANPVMGAKGIGRSYKGFLKQKAFDRFLSEIHNSSDWPMIKESIRITEPKSLLESGREEFFPDRFKAVVTIKGKQYGWIKVGDGKYELLDISKPFERQFTMLGNILRIIKFRTEATKLYEKGLTWEKNREEFETLGRRINNLTSAADIPQAYQNEVTRTFIWSSRLIAAKLNMLGISDVAAMIPGLGVKKGYYKSLGIKGQKLSRQQIAAAGDLAKFAVGVMTTSTLFALAVGGALNTDPDDSGFLDVEYEDKKGNKKTMNFTGGFSRFISLIYQMFSGGKRKHGVFKKYGGFTDPVKEVGFFIAGKAPPLTRTTLNVIAQKNMVGQETDIATEAAKYKMPLAIGQIQKQIERDGLAALFRESLLTYIGINAKDSRDYAKPNALTIEEVNDPTIKTFIDKGVEISKPDPTKVETKEINGKVTEHLSDYDEKTQKDYVDKWWKYYNEDLKKLKNGSIKVYVDKDGTATAPTTANGREGKTIKSFNNLSADQIRNVLGKSIKGDITEKVKAEVLKDKKPQE